MDPRTAVHYERNAASLFSRDKKDATYKLALLRALCEIAQSGQPAARWYADGRVGIPLALVAGALRGALKSVVF